MYRWYELLLNIVDRPYFRLLYDVLSTALFTKHW